MDITLQATSTDSVYRVLGATPGWSLNRIAYAVERKLADEWPCPMMTYNATRYSVLVRPGRKNPKHIYVRVALS